MTIGEYYELKIAREVDFGVYLESDLGDILLPQKYIDEGYKVDDLIKVFLYKDSEDRLIATTLEPYGKLGDIVALEVKDSSPHGAFMEWGLEKDLFVPKSEQHVPFEVGQRYVVRICYDHKTDRLLGVGKLDSFLSSDIDNLRGGQQVNLLIHRITELGYLAVIDGEYSGLLYANEVFEPLTIGDERKGFIQKIREDGKIDLRLYNTGVDAIDDNVKSVLIALEEGNGFLELTDKSQPDEVSKILNMSKKSFKKAIGSLYKQRKIAIEEDGIRRID